MEQHDGGMGFTPQPAIFAWLQDHKILEEMHDAFTPFTPEEFGMVATSLESMDKLRTHSQTFFDYDCTVQRTEQPPPTPSPTYL